MKSKNLLLPVMAAMLAGCLLTGCKNPGENTGESTGEPQPTNVRESDTSAAERTEEESATAFSFADLTDWEFWFGSGAGAWRTVLTVRADGTFEGEHLDSDMIFGEEYPNGTNYVCEFTGKFTEPVKVNDYTYSVTLEQIELAKEPGTEEIKDGIKFVYGEPYGLDDAEELLFYLPGAPIEELPEEYRSWMGGYGDPIDTRLPFYGLYNVNAGQGFSSHERVAGDEPVKYYITFEGEIVENRGEELQLRGLPQNIKGMRGEYSVSKTDRLVLYDENGNQIAFADFKSGDLVEILYCDRVTKKDMGEFSEAYALEEGKEIPDVQYIKKIAKGH